MKRILLFLSIVLAGVIFSCDKVDNPFPEDKEVSDTGLVWTDSAESTSNNGVRYALMEEFTGHTCTNCPDAARRITQLQNNKYGDTLIAIAMHLSDFASPRTDANPYKGAPPGAYYTDHRAQTEKPAEHEVYFNQPKFGDLSALPKGMVNRLKEANTENNWGQDLNKFFANPGTTVANVHLMNYYDATAKTFQTKIIIEWLEDHSGDLNLQVQCVQNNVVDWQLDGTEHDEDYVHSHVYRGAVNGAWGAVLAANTAGNRDTITYTRSITPYLGVSFDASTDVIAKDDFIIVAYLYKRDEMEVMQVNEAHLTGSH